MLFILGWGPAYTTTDPSDMIHQLSKLTAGGGSGVSEMGYHGIFLALQNVQPYSVCHFFTDAPAKDLQDLFPMALALKLSKNVKVRWYFIIKTINRISFFAFFIIILVTKIWYNRTYSSQVISWLTQFANFTGRRRRSVGRDRRRTTQHTAVGDYSGFTLTGSGNVYVLRKKDIIAAVDAISVSTLQVRTCILTYT